MRTVAFEIAKKMGKTPAGTGGYVLSSLKWDGEEASLLLKAGDLQAVKSRIDDDRTGSEAPALHYRSRGKSLEVCGSSLPLLLRFASQLDFASDDVCDVLAYAANDPFREGPAVKWKSLLLDKDSLSLKMEAELADDAEPEDFFARLMPGLERFGMGIIKNENAALF
ncbi:MAG: hypothetical protein HUJ80_09695 [Firmicutes bacterium]|nr:hypothetical protein [Bacillota bacterium]